MFDVVAGEARLANLQDPETTRAWRDLLARRAPGLDDWVVGAVFGGTYERDGLDARDRQLLVIGALVALGGCEPQLEGHVRTARRVGMSPEVVSESVAHLVPYVGLPRAMAAFRAVDRALSEVDG